MKELIETIAKALVDHPEYVRVTAVENEKGTTYELKVHPDDMGKVIGKQGKIAKSIRTVMMAAAGKEARRVMLEIL